MIEQNAMVDALKRLARLKNWSIANAQNTFEELTAARELKAVDTFLQETGVPFAHYLEHLRVRAAMLMLRNTRVRLSAAAEAAGFSDSELFERSFQRRTGMEARVYRKMLLGK